MNSEPQALVARSPCSGVVVGTWDLRVLGRRPDPRDWVGLYIHHRLHNRNYTAYARTNGIPSASTTFTGLRPGCYDLRLFLAGSYNDVARTRAVLVGPGVAVDAQVTPDGSLVAVAVDTVLQRDSSDPSASGPDGLTVDAPGNWLGLFSTTENGNYARHSVAWRYAKDMRRVALPCHTAATVPAVMAALAAVPPPCAPTSVRTLHVGPNTVTAANEDTRDVLFVSFPVPDQGEYEVRFFFEGSTNAISGNVFSGLSASVTVRTPDFGTLCAQPLYLPRQQGSGSPYGFVDAPPPSSGILRFATVELPSEKWTTGMRLPLPPVSENTLASGLFTLETRHSDVTHTHTPTPAELFDRCAPVAGYTHFFLNQARPHVILHAVPTEGNPVVCVVEETFSASTPRRVIMWTRQRTRRFLATAANPLALTPTIVALEPALTGPVARWSVGTGDQARGLLYKLDQLTTTIHCKFGVLYAAPGQTLEHEMLSNSSATVSPAFEHFLGLLGEFVTLNGFRRYAGGLDVRGSNSTGKTSVFTDYGSPLAPLEIMFHVAPLMPSLQDDTQFIDRKRHIGNDICVLVFKEGGEPIDFTSFVSHFNTIFLVVSPLPPITAENSNAMPQYRVTVVCKNPVQPFPPYFPNDQNIFTESPEFRDWILQKRLFPPCFRSFIHMLTSSSFTVINGERASLLSPDFRPGIAESRKMLLLDVIAACQGTYN